jgi:hypothetical protein
MQRAPPGPRQWPRRGIRIKSKAAGQPAQRDQSFSLFREDRGGSGPGGRGRGANGPGPGPAPTTNLMQDG